MGSTFKIRLKINHFYLPPLVRATILSLKLNSFPIGLPTFALVLLQATKQSERSFRKVNHVNSMMSFFSLEPLGAAHLTHCVSQIPCHSLFIKLWMNHPPDCSASSSPTSSLHSLSSYHTGLFAVPHTHLTLYASAPLYLLFLLPGCSSPP